MGRGLKDKVAIVGIGATEFSRNSGRSEMSLACEAIKSAAADAGLTVTDIDAIVKYSYDSNDEVAIAANLGIPNLRFYGTVGYGGGAGCATVGHGAMAVALGMANYAVAFRALNERSGVRYGQSRAVNRVSGDSQFHVPYGLLVPGQTVAVRARRHMHEYGTRSEHFGMIAVACRKHANQNPNAMMYGKPLTLEDHQRSRIIADPLRLYDYCLESDGACALVMTSAERAQALKQRPVHIMAAAQGVGPGFRELMANYNRPSIAETPETRYMAEELFRQAGISRDDIDALFIYDHFTPLVLMALENLGLCDTGEGGAFVEGGRLEWPDGELPLNTSGGNLSEAYIHGFQNINEAVRQLRGTSACQVKDAEIALVTSGNAVPTSGLILRR